MHDAFLTLGLTKLEEEIIVHELVNKVLHQPVEEALVTVYEFITDNELFNNCIVSTFTSAGNAQKVLIQRMTPTFS